MIKFNRALVISAALVSGALLWEGTKYVPYKDIAGIPTVCTGHTGKDINMDKIYSKKECTDILIADLQKHGDGIKQCITVPITQGEYDAYTLFAFNVGVSGFCSSRANRLLSQGQHELACKALASGPDGKPAWSYSNGRYIQGLQNRRQYERDMCLKSLR